MSLICAKTENGHTTVCSDGRITNSEGLILGENFRKARKIANVCIVSSAGSEDIIPPFFSYCQDHVKELREYSPVELRKLVKDFKKKYEDEFQPFNDTQSFMFSYPNRSVVIFYTDDDGIFDYTKEGPIQAIGSDKDYAMGMMDAGMSPQEAVRLSSKRYCNINDNVFTDII